MSGYASYGRRGKARPVSAAEAMTVTLSNAACGIALLPSFGPTPAGFTSSRYGPIVRKINQTSVDLRLGPGRAVRHVLLSADEAKELRTAFRESAEAYRLAGRVELVRPCADAADVIERALRAASSSPG
jgi:hypothetical protein